MSSHRLDFFGRYISSLYTFLPSSGVGGCSTTECGKHRVTPCSSCRWCQNSMDAMEELLLSSQEVRIPCLLVVDRHKPAGRNARRRSAVPIRGTKTGCSNEATVERNFYYIINAEAVEQGRTSASDRLQHGLAVGGPPAYALKEFLGEVEMALEVMD